MSIKETINKYAGDSERFVKLLHRLTRDLFNKHRIDVKIDDYDSRQLSKAWAAAINVRKFGEPDLRVVVEDIIGNLVERLIESGSIFKITLNSGPRIISGRQNLSTYIKTHYYEYLSVQVGLSILREMLGPDLLGPNPDRILDAAVVLHNIPSRARCFSDILGLAPLLDEISAASSENGDSGPIQS